ncbi:host-nuclease inhibitor Gam family protein [Bacillus horti]|uniref:Uncharacterized protein n=1 Tax=Caldalkalibacillus horti TaxID=77523 RepID=A0ABT9W533_9BACI|nr:host-nuclease inhibitor Gam family protein [Bacillus horti]MDQ0168346.1 hypothetical protein [Bacillus horti]
MTKQKNAKVSILSEETVQRFYELTQQAKGIDYELAELKKEIHSSLDQLVGENEKSSLLFGDIQLQRQIRTSMTYDQEKTVSRLEELQLHDCIETIRRPNADRINAAVTLGLLAEEELEGCQLRKDTPALTVRKVNG